MGYGLWSALQPLVDLNTGHVLAHEALLRGAPGTAWESPAALFQKATELGHRVTLEAIARDLALRRLADLPAHQKLFLNIDAMTPEIPATPGHPDVEPQTVVLELSEQQPVLTNPSLLAQVRRWRKAGHAIALDDYGSGYMGIGAILTLEPELLKLDRVIVADLDQDPKRQIIVKTMVRMCDELGITLIAEGIETPRELWTLQDLGVTVGQGFLLGRPARDPVLQVSLPSRSASDESQHDTPLGAFSKIDPDGSADGCQNSLGWAAI
ncbi:EAL domain-containing protein, partial [Sulfobacillus harzensis]